ncbi:Acyl-ACP thioesterase [Paenibacillus sp. ov031]|uniref:acyl-[acyl-carrier-protein] thioesterase n=1 Tax=Paenibacillus sp. ov031 TaxID=1761879 RepID=UPI00091556AB|nr:acyl-ACP thioesterase domain-containing protein [Paenibacillus sp. ov031]SHN54215.1 Acyl-ACP thioesterase [Paenibacillus sp. ov031]
MQSEQPFKLDYRIGSADADYKSQCRASALLEHMQLAADRDLAGMGVTVSQILNQGLGWMLLTTDVTIMRPARLEEEVSLQTWHKENKGVTWLRDYILTDREGTHLAEARTAWALVDLKRRRVVRPSALPFEVKSHPDLSLGEAPAKVTVPFELSLQEQYRLTVQYSSTDSNGHMNNARYADVCCDALTLDELAAGMIRLQISYHREIRMQELMIVERSEVTEGAVWVRGRLAEENESIIFEAKLSLADSTVSPSNQ